MTTKVGIEKNRDSGRQEAHLNMGTGNVQKAKDNEGMNDRLLVTSRAGRRVLPS